MDLRTLPRPRAAGSGGRPESAEALLVRHYRHLVGMAYLTLPADRGRHARVVAAHAVVQRALPVLGGKVADRSGYGSGYEAVRARVLRGALRRRRWPGAVLPRVWGVRLFTPPDDGGAELDVRLAELPAPARAGFALRVLDGLDRAETAEALAWAGVEAPAEAARAGDELLRSLGGAGWSELPPGYDACTVHLRPGDLLRRRRRSALVAAAVAVALTAAVLPVLGSPHGSTGRSSAPPPAARAVAPERRAADLWRRTAKLDLAVWPARGELVDDTALVDRAVTAWQQAGPSAATEPGSTPAPPVAVPQLLYAGRLDGTAVVLLTDGRSLARYTDGPASDGPAPSGPARSGPTSGAASGPTSGTGGPVLALAAAGDSDVTAGAAVVLRRDARGARYLLAPWVASAATRRLDRPDEAERPLAFADGVTDPVPGTAAPGCPGPVLQLRSDPVVAEQHAFLLADLGGLAPAHLTYTPPPDGSAPARPPREAVGAQALRRWAAGACAVPEAGPGVRQLNLWEFADQRLPQNAGELAWACLRADRWDGSGSAAAAVLPPDGGRAERLGRADGRACSRYEQDTVAQYRWRAPNGAAYLLVAASRRVSRLLVTTPSRRLDQPAPPGRTLALDDPGSGPAGVEAVTASGTRLRPIG
ncbi:hypothetical protein K353_01429 [Kitasatospora sp. SolWspMP-SS2h]|uniref:hypothetical protein n=1 Tax=Kitasatospora sp. SolWspMP-SS2h TaxID=1305729 RepID=UPI000DBA17B5|nr:hypothetical protein [Kitasatospora sp. SolWspMP-SS2h]RAJ44852.1 hypothetical protein K353_01429 [Kitasatospora sp. SolWspMP-SS2h]